MYTPQEPLTVDQWIARSGWPRRRVVALAAAILILIPLLLAWLEVGDDVFTIIIQSEGRHLFFFPLMIVFLLAVMGPLQGTRAGVVRSLRPLIQVDDDRYTAVVSHACRVNPVGELLAVAAGVLFFLAIEGIYVDRGDYRLLSLYTYLAGLAMFATTSWSIYGGFMVTRLTNDLLQLPVHIDIFNIDALEPIGRQSLYLALTFVGATLLSLFFVIPSDNVREFFSLDNIIIYSTLIVVTLTAFFLNMHRTHALLAAEKKRQFKSTNQSLARAYYRLQERISHDQDTDAVSRELNALAVSRQQLELTRTWPYDTGMLRTLFISILTPLMIGLARVIVPLLMK